MANLVSKEVYIFPVSFSQERLWFLNKLEPCSPSYNVFRALRLTGDLNVDALERALKEIHQRHEILRTTFKLVDDVPCQLVYPNISVCLQKEGVPRQLSSENRFLWAQDKLRKEAQRPFELSEGPLLRVLLLKLEENAHILATTVHHIVCDAWSVGVFIQELSTLYSSYVTDELVALPELTIQYADFAEWQREWLTGEVLNKQREYWQKQLSDIPALINLPTDYPRPPIQSYEGGAETFTLTEDLTQKLHQLSQLSGATLYMTLLSAFSFLLFRYTRQDDILVGSPIANRNRKEIEPLIGFFVNTLVLKTEFRDDLSFRDLLKQVRQTTLEAYAHQDLPFERLVEDLHPQRGLSYHPLFQVMFILQNAPTETLELPGLTLTPIDADYSTVKFDLTVSMRETPTGMIGVWAYSRDLFSQDTIQRMVKHFKHLLVQVLDHYNQPLSQISLLSPKAEQHLLHALRNSIQHRSGVASLPQGFEKQAALTPDQIAVICGESTLTYQDLNRRANQLAHYLRQSGIGFEDRVGLCFERSVEAIVAIWGVLKCGGAYVPVDPNYPIERQNYILQDACVSALLTQSSLKKAFQAVSFTIVCLDQQDEAIAAQSTANLTLKLSSKNLAYVIYTSGSTGRPKGVMVEHGGALNLFWALKTSIYSHSSLEDSSGQKLRVSVNGSLAFDTSVKQIVQLLDGHTLVMIPEEVRLDSEALQAYLSAHSVDVFDCTPSQLEILRTRGWLKGNLPKAVLLGGEAVTKPTWQVLQTIQNCRFFNLYGPTECTGDTTACEINEQSTPGIGRPLANVELYVSDRHQQLVPMGVPGELLVGGAGLARGYLDQPALTAERFVPNTFRDTHAARLYRTGDLVRYRSDGQLEFLGRLDHQVKIRGFRIELEEIESALEAQTQVCEAVVILWEETSAIKSSATTPSTTKHLVAYVVPEDNALAVVSLRRNLKEKLPEYMIPSCFVEIESLPLTPNGKVDRHALPPPDLSQRQLETQYVSAKTSKEVLLADIWRGVLGREQIGIHDNFFELGGDSILSIQIVARANQAGLYLTPRQVFQHQTIAELAEVAGTVSRKPTEQGLVTGQAPLIPVQIRFFEKHTDFPHHFNQAVFLEVSPQLDPNVLQQALQGLMTHHDALRSRFCQTEGEWQQHFRDTSELPLQIEHLADLSPTEQKTALEKRAAIFQASLDIAEGPLLRSILFQCGVHRPSRLLLIVHHLIIDGVSWRILLEDLSKGYAQIQQGQALQLPSKTTSFKAWASQMQAYASDSAISNELAYWRNQAIGAATLPLDFDAIEDNLQETAAQVSTTFSIEETQALLETVPAAYNTQINDVLLTALTQGLLSQIGGQSLRIDLEGHGREELAEAVDVSRTIGWFTAVFPVVLHLNNAASPGDFLKSVKEQLRQLPNRGISYGLLRYLHPDAEVRKSLQTIPPAQISFNYLGQFHQSQLIESGPILGLAAEFAGANRHPKSRRSCLLEISGRVVDGQLRMEWTYSQKLHRAATVEGWVNSFRRSLLTLVNHCLEPEAGGFTPSDFPFADLDEQSLDQVTALLADINPVGD